MIGLVVCPFAVCVEAAHTSPSLPTINSVTTAIFHFAQGMSSWMITYTVFIAPRCLVILSLMSGTHDTTSCGNFSLWLPEP